MNVVNIKYAVWDGERGFIEGLFTDREDAADRCELAAREGRIAYLLCTIGKCSPPSDTISWEN